ncbi:hypothetical protein C6P44_001673, partial [Monosporozyma unispora]
MVKISQCLVVAAATLSGANAVTTMAVTDEQVQMVELAVYVRDILGNMAQYLSFRQANPDQPYPSVLNGVVLKAMFAGNSDGWTTALTGIDPSTVQMMLTGVPWYSSRILPALESYLSSDGIVVSGINCPDCDLKTTSAAPVVTSTVTPTTSTSTTTSASGKPTTSSTSTKQVESSKSTSIEQVESSKSSTST